jgi:chromosome segregation protein
VAVQRRALSRPIPPRDVDLDGELSEAERALADALRELATLKAEGRARGEELAAVRRAESARQTERETARRRLADAERRAAEATSQVNATAEHRATVEAALAAAQETLAKAVAAERPAIQARETARAAADDADGISRAAAERSVAAASSLAELRGRLEAYLARQADEEARGIAKAARRVGGKRIDEDLVVDPGLRVAVEAALGETARGYLIDPGAVSGLAAERGMVVTHRSDQAGAKRQAGALADTTIRERAIEGGGGVLAEAVRRDGHGAAVRLLGRAVWLPDLDACVAIQPDLPPGWVAVPRDGSAVVTDRTVRLGPAEGTLERRVEADRLAAEVARLEGELGSIQKAADEAARAATAAREEVERRRNEEVEASAARRRAEDAERIAMRDHEATLREIGWHQAQAERLDAEVARARDALGALDGVTGAGPIDDAHEGGADGAAVAAWDARIVELRSRRDRLAGQVAANDVERRDADAQHARAQAALAMDEERIGRADRDAAALADRERALEGERETLRTELAAAVARETSARTAVEEVRAADAADRDRLATAERAATAARERLRSADDRLRSADHARLETKLALDGLREQLLVELASLGEPGIAHLRELAPEGIAAAADLDADDEAAVLNAALDAIAPTWAARAPEAEPPSPGRLATLRRRYHELGAANPFAVEEYAEVKARLDSLETQATDLRTAIASTRNLIDELNTMIADQFRKTFAALETAFEARFKQLFGGGQATLSLTDPGDLSATGVEIVARPPGKKAQALAMLSGGERALTAVALLFAMLEVRPVPFCVLDEVDAALDEANIGRFADAVRTLADRTQFIVITHNRGTIEAADALYGVTVGDDSVSRVISLRLDEAQALAERREELAPAG